LKDLDRQLYLSVVLASVKLHAAARDVRILAYTGFHSRSLF